MTAMSFLALLLLTGSVPVAAPPPPASAVAVARARILAPAEIRRVDGRIEVHTGDRKAPTQLHRTERKDGGQTADFY
ncbi:MAG: hypothetical protein KIT23_06225 [Sphingopyxis sp.]|nr:hypothetical protein [Sphingopyxis sp.]